MTNIKASIFAAFERMWFHMTDALNKKADKTHEHDNIYNKAEVDVLLSNKSDAEHTHEVADITDLSSQLNTKVPATRKINDKALNIDITLNAADVGADASGSAADALNESKAYTDTEVAKKATPAQIDSKIAEHNVDTAAHNDIRISLSELATKVNNFLDVDDATTDQLSELLTLISENADNIEAITNGKVNVSDIIDNLTTNTSDKPLSAAQGVVLKKLVDDLQAEFDVHTHAVVNGVTPEWAGSIADSETGWLAAWSSDGSKIKALDKGQVKVGNASYADSAGYAGEASHAYYLDTVAGNEIKIRNATGLTAGGMLWIGWDWADATDGSIIKDWVIGNFSRGGLANVHASTFHGNLSGTASSANYASSAGYAASATNDESGNNIASTYLPKSGGTMTGILRVNNAPIFGYRYGQSNDAPAFVFDKPGSNFTGIGANNEADTIYFGAVHGADSWTWNKDYKQKWKFNGSIIADTLQLSNSSYGTSLPSAGTPGRIFFKKV